MKIYFPWNNLGCLGFEIGKIYFDFYWMDGPWLYVNFHGWRNLERYRVKIVRFWRIIPDPHNAIIK